MDLPDGISDPAALAVVRKYAPLVRLHRNERHLPGHPEAFAKTARLRHSRPGRDRGWNKESRAWRGGDEHGAAYHDPPWPQVVDQSDTMLGADTSHDPVPSTNVRPRDGSNRHGSGSARGLFLQRARTLSDDHSGMRVTGANEVKAPVFVDTAYDRENHLVRVLYWFFYDLNHWHFMITHEGDWEHVSLIFTESSFRDGEAPGWLYLAQHNESEVMLFSQIGELRDETHCVIYVDKNGHPCRVGVEDRLSYQLTWRTWECDMVPVVDTPWYRFAGAWGEIGNIVHTTGPLGPYFKRNRDLVKVVRRNGRLNLKAKKRS